MNKLRRSYEARVLLIPLGASASRLAGEMGEAGLDGLMVVTSGPTPPRHNGCGVSVSCRPLSDRGWRESSADVQLGTLVADADIVVLLAADLTEVSSEVCQEAGAAARGSGALTAALVVGSAHWDSPADNTAMVVLRQAVDMLVVVNSLRLATPFVDVLRGGPRQEAVGV
jgi:hypothetical protein